MGWRLTHDPLFGSDGFPSPKIGVAHPESGLEWQDAPTGISSFEGEPDSPCDLPVTTTQPAATAASHTSGDKLSVRIPQNSSTSPV